MTDRTLPQPDVVDVGLKLANAISRAVHAPLDVAFANVTWGDFIRAGFELGLRAEDRLSSIEYGISQQGAGWIRMERDDDGAIEIREMSRSEVG